EAEMAVADLHEGEVGAGRLGAADQARARHAGRHRPDHGGARPGHALQKAAPLHCRIMDHRGTPAGPGSACRPRLTALPARPRGYSRRDGGIRSRQAGYGTRQQAIRTRPLAQDDRRRRFELLALPHLDAAYNLARWLAGNTTDAEDVVQDAYLRAYRYFDAFQGGNFRVWLLTIVRNAFVTWVKENRSGRMMFVPDTPVADGADSDETMWGSRPRDPESLLLESIDSQTLSRLMEQLPLEYRE